jgi:tetratricopeptide (TPR) repeat protein
MLATGDKSTTSKRGLARVYLKLGQALVVGRDYPSAFDAFEKADSTLRPYAAADPKDIRAKTDLFALEDYEAQACVDMLNPDLNPSAVDRAKTTERAIALLRDSTSLIEKLVAVDPGNRIWLTNLAYDKVTLGMLEQQTPDAQSGALLSASGISELTRQASSSDASMDVLELAASASLRVLPANLRNPQATVQFAERLVTLDHRRTPGYLALLAQAYRQNGQPEKAIAAANEGLALLPQSAPGLQNTRTKVILEAESQPKIRGRS